MEIIVVDDNDPSSNERYMTEDLLCKYLIDKRVIYIKHDRNKNGSAARNSGYKKSKGDYIMFLDDDDEFEKTKVEVQQKNLSGLSKDWGCNYTKYIKKLILNLQIIRMFIQKKKLKEFLFYKRKHNVSYYWIIRYCLYLLNRKIKRKCYGFKI